MPKCEFLYHEEKKTCAGCRGWFCLALGKRLKLSDTSDCTDNPLECTRYLEAHPELVEAADTTPKKTEEAVIPVEKTVKAKPKKRKVKPKKKVKAEVTVAPKVVLPPSDDCPYLGPVPAGEYSCCGYWCVAKDEPLRSVKRCKSPPSWLECRRRYDAERAGVKHARP